MTNITLKPNRFAIRGNVEFIFSIISSNGETSN